MDNLQSTPLASAETISEDRKKVLLAEGMNILDPIIVACERMPELQKGMSENMGDNLAILLDVMTEDEFRALLAESQEAYDTSPAEYSNVKKSARAFFIIKRKAYSRLLEILKEKNAEKYIIDSRTQAWQEDQKKFLRIGIASCGGIGDRFLPDWYMQIKRSDHYKDFLRAAVFDPEVEKQRRAIDTKVQTDLNG